MENWTVKSVDGKEVNKKEEETKAVEEQQEVAAEATDDNVVKVNLDQPPKQEKEDEQVSDEKQDEQVSNDAEAETSEASESPIEIVNEAAAEEVKEGQTGLQQAVAEASAPEVKEEPKVELPEGIDKLLKFVDETGGTLEDYVNLNKDLSDFSDENLIREYYRQSKPSWDHQDISDHMEDMFGYDEEIDETKDVRAKKRAFKDELYNAKKFLEGNREKYYADLKFKKQNNIPDEYQEAFNFHASYIESSKANEQLTQTFKQRTAEVFSEDFKGFDFKIGENTYRYKVNDSAKVKEYQSDINNFVKEFLAEDGTIGDAKGYHKAMYAAKNIDKIAQHFYEQGRAEALKQSAAEAKNINMDPRKDMSASVVEKGGTKVRVVDGGFDGRLRFKNYKNR